jgi:hypothetical protein
VAAIQAEIVEAVATATAIAMGAASDRSKFRLQSWLRTHLDGLESKGPTAKPCGHKILAQHISGC